MGGPTIAQPKMVGVDPELLKRFRQELKFQIDPHLQLTIDSVTGGNVVLGNTRVVSPGSAIWIYASDVATINYTIAVSVPLTGPISVSGPRLAFRKVNCFEFKGPLGNPYDDEIEPPADEHIDSEEYLLEHAGLNTFSRSLQIEPDKNTYVWLMAVPTNRLLNWSLILTIFGNPRHPK